MSRDIKFRAWDDYSKEWLLGYEYPNLGGFSMYGECMLFEEWSGILNRFILQQKDRKPEHLKLMQYTGLKDWNVIEPKEVYESDIVRCYKDGMQVGNLDVIEFKNGSFCFRHRNMAIYEWENMSEEHEFSYHVIGNIYQNPELLKL